MASDEDSAGVGGGKGDTAVIVAGAVVGHTLEEIAAASGLSVSSVRRRLDEPSIRAQIRSARDQRLSALLAGQTTLAAAATARLAELIADEDPEVAHRAAALVLATTVKLAQAVDLTERVRALEAATPMEGA
jgi:hypothetical protein